MKIPKTFYEWCKQYIKRDTIEGDLVRDIYDDSEFPVCADTFDEIYRYLSWKAAFDTCEIIQETIAYLWQKYQTYCGKVLYNRLTPETLRDSISPRTRFKVFKRDHYRCQLCGRSAEDGVTLEIDHIHPVSKGGTDQLENLQTLCFECNRGKRDSVL